MSVRKQYTDSSLKNLPIYLYLWTSVKGFNHYFDKFPPPPWSRVPPFCVERPNVIFGRSQEEPTTGDNRINLGEKTEHDCVIFETSKANQNLQHSGI